METSTSSPEQTSSALDKEVFTLDNIEQFRALTKEMYDSRYQARFETPMIQEDVDQDVSDAINDYLANHNINSDEERMKYASHLRNFAYDKMSDSAWEHGAWTDEAKKELTPTGPELLRAKCIELFGDDITDTSEVGEASEATDNVNNSDPLDSNHRESITEVAENFDDYRQEYAGLLADRSKKMGLFERSSSVKDMELKREEYAEVLRASATELYFDYKEEGLSDEEITEKIDAFISEQMDAFIHDIEAKRAADFADRNRFVKKGLEYWASWGPKDGANLKQKLFSKGNLAKGGVYAGLGIGVGALAAPLVGIVGGGAAAAVGATLLSRSIARSLVGARLDAAANAETIAKAQADDVRNDAGNLDETAEVKRSDAGEGNSLDINHQLLLLAEERTNVYRKRNQRRLIGGIAISTVAGATAASLIAGATGSGLFGKVGDWSAQGWDTLRAIDLPNLNGPEVDINDRDNDKIPNSSDSDRDGDGVLNVDDARPNNPDITTEKGTDVNGGQDREPRVTLDTADTNPRQSLFHGEMGARHFNAEAHEALAEHFNNYTVKSGDTVWALSEQFLHEQGIKNPSVYEIDATKDALLLDLKVSGHVDANGWLTAGDKLHIKH